jgi:hypothetical protein
LTQAEGFVATKFELESGGLYRVRDFWSGHRGFEVFRERCSEGFAEFDRQIVQELVEKEEFLGAYYEKPDHGSEQDLVLS